MVATISIVLGHARVEPAALSADDWSSILQEAKGDLRLDYLRGMQSVRQIIQPDVEALRIQYWADPGVIRAGLRSCHLKEKDVFLYCTTPSDTTFPHEAAVKLRRDGDRFVSSHVVLSKRGGFWKLKTDWTYWESSGIHPNPRGYDRPWFKAERVRLEYIGYGAPLGNLCMSREETPPDATEGWFNEPLLGEKILRSLHKAQRGTDTDLEWRLTESRAATERLRGYLERLGARV